MAAQFHGMAAFVRLLVFAVLAVPVSAFADDAADLKTALQLIQRQEPAVQRDGITRLTRLAEFGNASAAFELGCLYANGTVVRRDPAAATAWWIKAADGGDGRAAVNLGMACLNQDAGQAVAWFRRGVELKDAVAMNELGRCYLNGTGVDKSDAEALAWFKRSAEAGNVIAVRNVGVVYFFTDTELKNPTEGVRWFQKAADQGNADAMWNLSLAYAGGEGVAENGAMARQWAQKAADAGSADAKAFLARFAASSVLDGFRNEMLADIGRDLDNAKRNVQKSAVGTAARKKAADDVRAFTTQQAEYAKMDENELLVRLIYAYASADGLFQTAQEEVSSKLEAARDYARAGDVMRIMSFLG